MGRSKGKKPKADCIADTRGGQWAGIPHVVLDHPAWLSRSLLERAILIEMVRRMNGYNNGKIAISQRELAMRLGTQNFGAISRATAGLMEAGLIDVNAEGDWKQRKAREYRLTFVNTMQGNFRIPATNDYLHWTPTQKSSADNGSAETPQSADNGSAEPRLSADDVSARIRGRQRKTAISPESAADHGSALIGKPYPPVKNEGEPTWSDIRKGYRSNPPADQILDQAEKADLRLLVIDYLHRTNGYARDLAQHPACRSAGVTEGHLSKIRTGRNGAVQRHHADAIITAISN